MMLAVPEKKDQERPGRAVGQLVKGARESHDMTQGQLAEVIGTDRVTVSRIESGKQKSMALNTARGIASALGLNVTDLAPGMSPVADPLWVQEFVVSKWHKAMEPTSDEMRWLRRLPDSFWGDFRPTPEDVAELLFWRRKRAKQ